MIKTNKIEKILETSKKVILSCSLENGAIVAANTDYKTYPSHASDYRYVWPRDAAYICVAADLIGLNIQEPFFDWIKERPEGFEKEGLLFQNYATNGKKHWGSYQPDQAGAMLWAIRSHFDKNKKEALKYKKLIQKLADGLSNNWKDTHFVRKTQDLWEEGRRQTSATYETNHTYSLAACARGLRDANELISNKRWIEVATQMEKEIDESYDEEKGFFLRSMGKIKDYNIDASLLGLVYPFNVVKVDDARMEKTVSRMEELIVENGGVHRFQMDYYDGDGSSDEGSGAWPLLNFWMSIYYSIKGDEKNAEEYFMWVVDRVDDEIAEQLFEDDRVGVRPLAWSHAMFIVACDYLGLLK